MVEGWRARMRERLPRARFDEPLSRHTTFRIGGPADCYLEPRSREELSAAVGLAREERLSILLLGWGSNLLVRDGGWRGLVLRLRGDFERVEFLDAGRVRVGAGVRVPRLVSLCAGRGLAGSEPLVGVPGTVGGALVMNAGTRDGEIGPLVFEVEVMDFDRLEPASLRAPDLSFGYRRSNLEGRLILGCVLQLKPGTKLI